MTPPRSIPQDLLDEYTMHGRIPILNWYFDDRPKSDQPVIYTQDQINQFLKMAIARQTNYYGITDTYLYQALDKYPIQGLSVAIMGSQQPWYESVCLAYGGHPTVIDYHKIESQHPGIKTITIDEYEQNRITFDTAISISSFEHDGLGRYGDPLSPNADLLTMQKMKDVVKVDGILYLSIPVGRDKLIWNAHRIYGKHRLPKLLQGWKILDAFGYSKNIYDEDTGLEAKYQPIFVLQNIQGDHDNYDYLEGICKEKITAPSISYKPIKLHIGCGSRRLPGFIHIDARSEVAPDVVADVSFLDMFEDNSVDLIYFCHGLEHIKPHDVQITLAEWKRILKPNGILRLSLPDFGKLAYMYICQNVPLSHIIYAIHGGQDYPENTHFWSWDFRTINQALTNAGFIDICRYDPKLVNPQNYVDESISSEVISLNIEARKPERSEILLATSIAPRNLEKQQAAIQSWKSIGFTVASFNNKEEMNQLSLIYENISLIKIERDARAEVGRPLVYIEDILRHLQRYGPRICGIINSDIRLESDDKLIEFLVAQAQDSLVFSSRLDVDSLDDKNGEIYSLGFDFFVFDKKFINIIPSSKFCLGMPWWDFFLPFIAMKSGLPLKCIINPFAYHLKHHTNYNLSLWNYYGVHFAEFFNPALAHQYQELLENDSIQLQHKLLQLANNLFLPSLYQQAKKVSYRPLVSSAASASIPTNQASKTNQASTVSLPNQEQIINLSVKLENQTYNLKILINPEEYTQKLMVDAFSKGVFYEPEVSQILIKLLKQGDYFIDIGAHIGYFSLWAALLVGEEGKVLTCEPEQNNYLKIIKNIGMNNFENIRLLNVAVGDQCKTVQFFINEDNGGGHALWDVSKHPFNERSRIHRRSMTVNMITIDHLFEYYQLNKVKLLKIDTEGAEHQVLRGALTVLSQGKISYIIAEINRFGLEQMGTNEMQLRSFMEAFGYNTYLLEPQTSQLIRLLPGQYYNVNQVFNVLFSNQETI